MVSQDILALAHPPPIFGRDHLHPPLVSHDIHPLLWLPVYDHPGTLLAFPVVPPSASNQTCRLAVDRPPILSRGSFRALALPPARVHPKVQVL